MNHIYTVTNKVLLNVFITKVNTINVKFFKCLHNYGEQNSNFNTTLY